MSRLPLLIAALCGNLGVAILRRAGSEVRDQDDACACRNWKQTYGSRAVRCGLTNEFYVGTGKSWLAVDEVHTAWDRIGPEFCTKFFETIDDDFCVNVNMGEDKGSWCFVDAACERLNGGARVNKQLSWKTCEREKDKMLRTYSPEALAQLAKQNDWDMGLLHKMSYPLQKPRWRAVSNFWNATVDSMGSVPPGLQQFNISLPNLKVFLKSHWGSPGKALDDDLRTEMQLLQESDEYASFDTERSHKPPHVIVKGEQVYLVLPDLVCLSGCEGGIATPQGSGALSSWGQ